MATIDRVDPWQLEHGGAIIRGEAEPRVTAGDGLVNLRVTKATA